MTYHIRSDIDITRAVAAYSFLSHAYSRPTAAPPQLHTVRQSAAGGLYA